MSLNTLLYFSIIGFSVTCCLFWADFRFKKFKLDRVCGLEITLAFLIGGLIGSRAFFILYVAPSLFPEGAFKIKNILSFWNGGFVFYGGLIGGLLAAWALIKWKKLSFYTWADTLIPVLSGGYALGRLACFFNGCCYGKFCSLPWAIDSKHPTQLYTSISEFLILIFLLWKEKKTNSQLKKLGTGEIFFTWLTLHASARILIENFRDDFRGPIYLFSISTWISLLFLTIALPFFFFHAKKNIKNRYSDNP